MNMLLSHNYGFIFIKTKKTAGTSIEISLSRYCTHSKDVITPISKADEKIREQLGIFPKNSDGKTFRNHMPAKEIQRKVAKPVWSNYWKFCFERNPWDKLVSMYFFQEKRGHETRSFEEFVRSFKGMNNFELYTDHQGKVMVDFIGQYERLQQDLAYITHHLGIPFDGWLPHAKGNLRDKQVYRDFFDAELRAIVQQKFRKEINHFGYTF